MKCPYCAGEIETGVKKCRHCGEWLDARERLRERGRRDVQTGAAQTGGTCGCIILIFLAALVYAALGGGQ